jgi:putative tryptophan/tyrosine transport system substrate-binding protein
VRRRDVILALGAAASPLTALAQQSKRIGFISSGSAAAYGRHVAAFQAGLKKQGYIEGVNLSIEYRWAEGNDERLRTLAVELVSGDLAAIAATGGTNAPLAVKAASEAIPIVFAIGADPVKFGLVASLNHPGSNITGASFLSNALLSKQLDLLDEARQGAARVGLLVNPANPNAEQDMQELVATGTKGRDLIMVEARSRAEIERALTRFHELQIPSILIFPDALFTSLREQIASAAKRDRMATIYNAREFAEVGGLLAYGPDQADTYRQVGNYVGRILAGEKAADLPVVLATQFELVINLNTASALGLTIPPTLLARADEVIE